MSTRRFELIRGRSCKFWEATIAGCRATIRYGRIGTAGQTLVKTFHNPEEADRQVGRMIAAKMKKGYAEAAAV